MQYIEGETKRMNDAVSEINLNLYDIMYDAQSLWKLFIVVTKGHGGVWRYCILHSNDMQVPLSVREPLSLCPVKPCISLDNATVGYLDHRCF